MAKKATKKKTSGSTKSRKAPAKKSAAKKAATKKAVATRSSKKAASKPVTKKKTAKKVAKKKTATKKAATKPTKKAAKKAPTKAAAKPSKKAAVKKPSAAKPEPAKAAKGKSGRKGITIVTPKPAKKAKAKKAPPAVPALTGSILGMGLGSGKPLIPSGPKAGPVAGEQLANGDGSGKKPKSPFNKRQLDKYREILVLKRAELLGDIDSMENEALKSQSGSLSHLPQHMAEQGSETYEQSLSLDLAAADRVLLREIDAALKRIADRTYGLCERTGKPISKERLAELPWARYSIEAAREMERRTS